MPLRVEEEKAFVNPVVFNRRKPEKNAKNARLRLEPRASFRERDYQLALIVIATAATDDLPVIAICSARSIACAICGAASSSAPLAQE